MSRFVEAVVPPIDLYPYALAALGAYGDNPTISEPTTDTEVLVTHDPHFESPIIAFRGTEGVPPMAEIRRVGVLKALQDWHTNLDGGFTALRDQVVVREGFARAWISVKDQVMEFIGRDRVYLTGHSLGGALAVVAALDIALEHEVTLVTFGQPRVCHRITPIHHNIKPYVRVVHNNDVVPRVPLEMGGYVHRGQLVYFDHDGDMHLDPGGFDRLADRVAGRLDAFGDPGLDGINDHEMERYVELTKAFAA